MKLRISSICLEPVSHERCCLRTEPELMLTTSVKGLNARLLLPWEC